MARCGVGLKGEFIMRGPSDTCHRIEQDRGASAVRAEIVLEQTSKKNETAIDGYVEAPSVAVRSSTPQVVLK